MTKTTKTTKSSAQTIDWAFLTNKLVADTYKRFVKGDSSVREIQREFRNTEYLRDFNRLVRRSGVVKAREAARSALRRKKLV